MGRLFVTNREIDLINDITKELIKDVVGQEVIYYAISEELTEINLYNESDEKIFETPISIETLVEFKGESSVTTTKFGLDSIYDITVFFHKKDLTDKNIILREGDFIQYGKRFYEIMKLTRPKDIYGQQENIPGIHAECRIAREGQFRTGLVEQKSTFTQSRGKQGGNQLHDKRALQDGGRSSLVGGSAKVSGISNKNTSPFDC